ncbi:hypothetical protein cyc_07018 [Cyclospora cayetanensis]|uniref:Uncharacterized protein n=1 Tax=Cyclospora cayetanensis TaxID=88456 RepID=A0A1D3DA90_9EIME|nr:hypothetical protein cyc_07018 [Cyclospora cayetanensis]
MLRSFTHSAKFRCFRITELCRCPFPLDCTASSMFVGGPEDIPIEGDEFEKSKPRVLSIAGYSLLSLIAHFFVQDVRKIVSTPSCVSFTQLLRLIVYVLDFCASCLALFQLQYVFDSPTYRRYTVLHYSKQLGLISNAIREKGSALEDGSNIARVCTKTNGCPSWEALGNSSQDRHL